MPSRSLLSRCASLLNAQAIAYPPVFGFLAPRVGALSVTNSTAQDARSAAKTNSPSKDFEDFFFDALTKASTCSRHRPRSRHRRRERPHRASYSTTAIARSKEEWDFEVYAEVVPKSEERAEKALHGQPDPGGTAYHTPAMRGFFDSHPTRVFAAGSHLPEDFFIDVHNLQAEVQRVVRKERQKDRATPRQHESPATRHLGAQVKLLESVRHLEEKLAAAKAELQTSISEQRPAKPVELAASSEQDPLVLTKEDYKGLVDLYYHTHMRRFGPDAPDNSPTPVLLEDYAFKLSEDFGSPEAFAKYYMDDEGYESPLKAIEEALKSSQLREIGIMQKFVDLLLDDYSSNRALYEVYQQLPAPGVSYLPKGVIRIFLQRMSTPWVKSEKSMLRYLALIDDMQRANLPITTGEWSSAIYLAGRAFTKVTTADMKSAFQVWKRMEQEAGVQASHVTFNILFDIAVHAGKYVIAQGLLKQMHERGLKLNRLGRVSLIYYHGMRRDGDGVRKAYRDFVDAGEIVDTLVLNCVMSALYNAGEPTAAEQIYARMKDLQKRFQMRKRPDGSETLYMRYPHDEGQNVIDQELASNSLGRVILTSSNLKKKLPEHYLELQSNMPLTPNEITFRIMFAYHANHSGDLDRLTVLLNEMSQKFKLLFSTTTFQVLFKGFALHGRMGVDYASWNLERLDKVWKACRQAIREAESARRVERKVNLPQSPKMMTSKEVEETPDIQPGDGSGRSFLTRDRQSSEAPTESAAHAEPITPPASTMPQEDNAEAAPDPIPQPDPENQDFIDVLPTSDLLSASEVESASPPSEEALVAHLPKRTPFSPWNDLVIDLAVFPAQRRKDIERIHSQLFDDEQPNSKKGFINPFSDNRPPPQPETQKAYYPLGLGHNALDHEEGEYTLPSPVESIQPQDPNKPFDRQNDSDSKDHEMDSHTHLKKRNELYATRVMICWVLRAYARVSGQRSKLEEVWTQARKVYRPLDELEKQSVYRVLRRCLRDCDRYGPSSL